MSWLHQRMVESAPGGSADVDAFLAGQPLPSQAKARTGRRDALVEMGGEVAG